MSQIVELKFQADFSEAEDYEQMTACLTEIQNISEMLEDLENSTDDPARRIGKIPDLTMPESYYTFMEENM